MIRGRQATVVRRVQSGLDEMGESVFSEAEEAVANVLAAPSSTD